MATKMKVEFLVDGSIKLVIDGPVPEEVHFATEEALRALVYRLGGKDVVSEREHHHHHHHSENKHAH